MPGETLQLTFKPGSGASRTALIYGHIHAVIADVPCDTPNITTSPETLDVQIPIGIEYYPGIYWYDPAFSPIEG